MLDEKKLSAAIGSRIKQLRRMQTPEMNQARLGKILGLTRTSVTNIESGKQKLTVDTLFKLCEAFSVEVSELVPKVSEVLSPQRQVVVGGQSFDVPAKAAGLISSLLPAQGGALPKSRKK
jgi:transcriptional regulator with XRE-family HTH domain